VPAILAQRICGTGFELLRQAADQITLGYTDLVLCVGTESMSRNPIAAYTHRSGFKLGAPVEFKDFLWEALDDPAARVSMIQTAETLARKYGITREQVDRFAELTFERALAAQASGFLQGEITPVTNEIFKLDGYADRSITLPRKIESVNADTHPRPSTFEALQKLRTVYPGGVQTAGNSSALVDGAAAILVGSLAAVSRLGKAPLAHLLPGCPLRSWGSGRWRRFASCWRRPDCTSTTSIYSRSTRRRAHRSCLVKKSLASIAHGSTCMAARLRWGIR
jgi:acetyl-CoA C-acetyltransferase